MPSEFKPSLLHGPSQPGIRTIGRALLANARAARGALADRSDPEALHDARVAMRRLRTWLQLFRDQLGRRRFRNAERALRKAARASNHLRDAEVFAAWLKTARDGLTARQKVGGAWLLAHVSPSASDKLDEEAPDDIEGTFETLARELPVYRLTHHLDEEVMEPRFSDALASAIRQSVALLRRRLARIRDASDDEGIHRARIAGKRLRYLLEPMAPSLPGAPDAITSLKRLQDTLGDLHDAHVWLNGIRERAELHLSSEARRLVDATESEVIAVEVAAGPDIRPGLVALSLKLRERLREGHAAVVAEWSGPVGEEELGKFVAIADACDSAGSPGIEIERKFLLLTLPENWPEGEAVFIDQGYLPGSVLVERVRRVRSRTGERFFRTIKSGIGLARLELEEEASREVFDALWPLTIGRRVTKRRYRVPAGTLTWEIDEFTDRDLVLAEVELPHVDHAAPIPDWLEAVLVREVTGDPAFANSALAR